MNGSANNDRPGMTLPDFMTNIDGVLTAERTRLNLRGLFENMSALSVVTRLEELLPHLARILADSVGVQQCSVYLYNQDLSATSAHLRWGYSPQQMETLRQTDNLSSPLMFASERHVIVERSILQRVAGSGDNNLLPRHPAWYDAGWRGDIMVPFIWNDHVEGMAYLWLPEGQERFHPVQIEIAEGVARQAAGTINHLRVLDAERSARRQTEMLLQLSRTLNSSHSLDEIYLALAQSVRSTVGTDAVSIVVEHHDGTQPDDGFLPMRRAAALGMTDDELAVRDEILRESVRLRSTIDQLVRKRSEPAIVHDLQNVVLEPRLRENIRQHGVTELLAAPIFVSGNLHGVLYSWSRHAAVPLAHDHLAIVDTMTRHAAASIERLSLIELERRQREMTEALLDVNRALGGSEDSVELVQIATRAVREILHADLASAFIFGPGDGDTAALFTDGATGHELVLLTVDARIPTETIPVEIELAHNPRVYPIHDFAEVFGAPLDGFPQYLAQLGVERAVAVPVVSRQETLGVIYAWYRTPAGTFRQADLQAVGAVAIELAAGLDRSALIQSERIERNRAETLFSFSRILNQSIEVEAVCGSILATLGALFPGALVSLALDGEDHHPNGTGSLDCPAADTDEFRDLLAGIQAHPVPEHRQIGEYDVIASPLSVGPDVLGSVILAQASPGTFSSEDRDLLAGLAPQAANAIRRARLFTIADRHISELTLLHEVGRTIATRSSLTDIFGYIADAIREVVNYTTGIIALECSDSEHLEVVTIWGDLPAQREGTRVPVGGSILGAVYRSQKPVVVDDVDSHPQAWSARTAVWKSIVCVPLMSGTTAIGSMLLGHRETGFFSGEDVRLVSLLAGQAGAAIYQARESERRRDLYRAGVEALAAAVDAKDSYIHSHSRQVSELCRKTAETLGLPSEEVEQIALAGLLHDVGKIGIPDQILTKPGRLDAQERLVMITHSTLGERIVAAHPALAPMARLVRHHHEWHNGSGYPDGLRGDEVPLGSAIIAVADAFGSMTSSRPYRRPLSFDVARKELLKWSGIQFHPSVVDAFLVSIDDTGDSSVTLPFEPVMALQPIQSVDIVAPRILGQIATEISHLTELYPFLDRVQQIICDELKYDDVHILLTDETEGDLVLAASTTRSELVGRYRIRQGEGISGTAMLSREVINCGDVDADPRARLSDMGSSSILAVPLIVEDVVIGLLGSGSPEPHRFDDRDVSLMIAIAGQIAPTIRVAQLHDQAKRAATTDGLTGVMNHRAFYQRLEGMLGELDLWDEELHLLIVDVIGLKAVNDVHGHLAGDRALRSIASALKSRVRIEDEVARYGGDEFVVIVRGTPRGGLLELVERLSAPVSFMLESGYGMDVRLRCGFATAHSSEERSTELVARADAGLYAQVSPTERIDLMDDDYPTIQTDRFDLPERGV